MKSGPLWKISVVTTSEAEEAVAEALQALLHQTASSWTDFESRRTTVSVYLSTKPDWPEVRRSLQTQLKRVNKCGLNLGPGRVSLEKVRRENWAESWKRHFKALEVGTALLIRPSWIRRRPRKGQAVVILDPGLSFGTGQHPTTGFCLEQIAAGRRPGTRQSFLDIGTGSGILAIAAAKLGYSPIEALDFDPEAIQVARANARRNRVLGSVRIRRADLTRLPRRGAGKFDLICANLVATLLISERKRIVSRLDDGGVLVLAGILKAEFPLVQRAYGGLGLRLTAARTEAEWRSGALRPSRKFS